MSDLPALIPYLILYIIYLIKSSRAKESDIPKSFGAVSKIVHLYALLILCHFLWQVGTGVVEFREGLRSSFLFLAPVAAYKIFQKNISIAEIKTILVAIIFSGFLSGTFFVYDSMSKLAFRRITDYSILASNYVTQKHKLDYGNDDYHDPSGRDLPNNRSFGLLETHSVSSTWIAFAAFASLSLISKRKRFLRFCVIMLSSLMILIGLNFTSIISFGLVIFLLEFKMISLFSGKISKKELRRVLAYFFIACFFLLFLLSVFPERFILFFEKNISFQLSLVFSGAGEKKITFVHSILTDGSQKIWESLLRFPLLLLTGEGFSSFGALKGGDYGFIETFLRFGLPFFSILVFVILKITWNVYLFEKKEEFKDLFSDFRFLRFSSFVLLFLLLMDLHYSTWHLKSVLPIVFIALGLYTRFFLLLKKTEQASIVY